MKKLFLFVVVFNMWLIATASAASLTAKVNRNPVPAGEIFVLSLEYDGDPGNQRPDFSVLEKDFTVSMISNSYRGTYRNGKMKKTYIWEVSLMANKIGRIEIPSLSVGTAQSQPINLQVVAADASSTEASVTSGPKFAVSRSISTPNPFVQQQINYSFKIKTNVPLQGTTPQFMATNTDEWIIRALGEPTIKSVLNNGVEEKEITFNYALFPQKSGKLIIPEVVFQGYYVSDDRQNNSIGGLLGAFGGLADPAFGLDMFGRKIPVNLKARAISMEVKKIPDENNGNWWLPAKKVEIYSDWQQKLPEFKTGEAVAREIYLRVTGVIDSQLPQIQIAEMKGMKIYPEKPQTVSEVKGEDVVSVMKIKTVYIPEKAGELTIPSIVVNWYNVLTNKFEQQILPAQKIKVVQGATPILSDVETAIPASQNENNKTDMNTPLPQAEPIHRNFVWLYVVLAFLGGVLISWLILRRQTGVTKSAKAETKEEKSSGNMMQAVRNNDLKEIRNQVLLWAKKTFPSEEIRNLDDVAAMLNDEEFTRALKQLRQALYRGSKEDFNVSRFMDIFVRISKQAKKRQKRDDVLLPKLYK